MGMVCIVGFDVDLLFMVWGWMWCVCFDCWVDLLGSFWLFGRLVLCCFFGLCDCGLCLCLGYVCVGLYDGLGWYGIDVLDVVVYSVYCWGCVSGKG